MVVPSAELPGTHNLILFVLRRLRSTADPLVTEKPASYGRFRL